MMIAIQCASMKKPKAGVFRAADGRRVGFVARPKLAPKDDDTLWSHPDGPSEVPGVTWRQQLEQLNTDGTNALRLLQAHQLYKPAAYERLVARFGIRQVLVLSAGWGLVRADYLLPSYDVTFSSQAEPYKRRRTNDFFRDFVQVQRDDPGPLVFLGGKDYLPLFRALADPLHVEKIVMFRCAPEDANAREHRDGDWTFMPFATAAETNWHYACADRLCDHPGFLTKT